MRSRGHGSCFGAVLAFSSLVALGEAWCIHHRWKAAQEAATRYHQRAMELAAMREVVPPPTSDTAAAIEADLARAERAVALLQKELGGHGPAASRRRRAKAPAARTDAYFDLAAFVERTRALARRWEVEVRPAAARFGFGNHANEGPESWRIEAVFQQRQVAQYLMEALIESRPRAVLSVKREAPLTRQERAERDAAVGPVKAAASPEGPDYFVIDPRASVRVPGFVESLPFQVAFIGQTETLRQFLNRLATFELPILVREVAVEPAMAEESATTPATRERMATVDDEANAATSIVVTAGTVLRPLEKANSSRMAAGGLPVTSEPTFPSAAAPIVARPWSRFTVTVELIDLVSAAPPASAAAPAAPAS